LEIRGNSRKAQTEDGVDFSENGVRVGESEEEKFEHKTFKGRYKPKTLRSEALMQKETTDSRHKSEPLRSGALMESSREEKQTLGPIRSEALIQKETTDSRHRSEPPTTRSPDAERNHGQQAQVRTSTQRSPDTERDHSQPAQVRTPYDAEPCLFTSAVETKTPLGSP